MRKIQGIKIILCIGLFVSFTAQGQSVSAPLNQDYYHKIERLEIKSGRLSNQVHSNIRPFERSAIINMVAQFDSSKNQKISKVDQWNIQYLKNDNWEYLEDGTVPSVSYKKPILKYIYRKKADFLSAHTRDYDIHVSPILNLNGGSNILGGTDSESQFINTRGVEVRGSLNNKLGFYTMFTENQATTPDYIRTYARAQRGFPYNGFTKVLGDDSLKMKTDYIMAMGYIAFRPIKNLSLQFGHDKTFIGSGIRSMVISDFSAPYLNLKANAKIGRMQYLFMVAQMNDLQIERPATSKVTVPPKFMAFHHLNFNVTKNFNFGLFENVFFGPRESGFDMNYLNPIIFYRFVEGFLGSSDNALVGVDMKFNFFKTASLYGQFVLDEFNLTENKKKGWWAKKYAAQLGLRYIDVLTIKNLDLQIEGNLARPYTFSHLATVSNSVNYNVPVAHPLGANFAEFISILRYQPFGKLNLRVTYMNAVKGMDGADGFNWGGDIKKPNGENRPKDYENFIGQGYRNNIQLLDVNASFMLVHNLFIDASYLSRTSSLSTKGTESLLKAGIRWNIADNYQFF